MHFDLVFNLRGEEVNVDHAYALYSALSRILPEFHNPTYQWRFAPINGQPVGGGRLRLTRQSVLRIRVPEADIRRALRLAGRRLDIAGDTVRLGTPRVSIMSPAPELIAALVTFRNGDRLADFLQAARNRMQEMNIRGEPQVPLVLSGKHRGEPRRRVIRIKDRAIVGYTLIVTQLNDADSLRLQAEGLGGRTRIGCGFFIPLKRQWP